MGKGPYSIEGVRTMEEEPRVRKRRVGVKREVVGLQSVEKFAE